MATAQRSKREADLGPRTLHLAPRSRPDQRLWIVGGPPVTVGEGDALRLEVRPDCHESFASLRAILAMLRPWAGPEQQSALMRLEGYLREACPKRSDDGAAPESHGHFLASSVAFAVLRRISRESVYTARVIDLAARTLNTLLASVPGCQRVVVEHVDRLDRPTLKVLARAMLLLSPHHRFAWVWYSTTDPLTSAFATGDPFVSSRTQLLRQILGILSPTLQRRGATVHLVRPRPGLCDVSGYDISAALVVQNYDFCFLWCDALAARGGAPEVCESFRLRALAALNVGHTDEALTALQHAEEVATQPGRQAHLAYLQGLLSTKRHYDLTVSSAHYHRGLQALAGARSEVEDLALERGWLLNGLALNEALLWRRSRGRIQHYTRAFELERQAFDLVRYGDDPARFYLRFNLLANCAFLLEMRGDYDHAIQIFQQAFDFGQLESPTLKRDWDTTFGYRIGLLHYWAGRLDEADRLVRLAAEQDSTAENWATQERILRALGIVALERGDPTVASQAFARGLDLCREARAAEGTREHARGLMLALVRRGRPAEADDLHTALNVEENIGLLPANTFDADAEQALRPSPPSPKLPAYIPEVDLEEIPNVDLNRYLGNAPSVDVPVSPAWRG